jgi:NADPH2:quinone reductase
MRTCEVTAFGGPEVLEPGERPDPVAGTGEVVVRIRAAAVNPTDIGTRSGSGRARMPELRPPFVLGWDLAGEVAEVGEEVTRYSVGDRVCGMIPFGRIGGRVGAYAEMAAVDPEWLAPVPEGVSFEEGSTLPLNSLTAAQALDFFDLEPGSRLLVTGASGGVGGYAVRLALEVGLRVVAMAGRDDEDWVRELGASEVLPRGADLSAIDPPLDGVLDAVPLGPALAAPPLRDGGTAVFTRPPHPPEPERRMRFETVWVRPDAEKLAEMAGKLAAGVLRTRVARVLPLEQAADAHRLAEAGGLHGKVVLKP